MPLIEITASRRALGGRERSEVLRAVNTAIAAALAAAPDAAWSIWRDVDEGGYVIGGDGAPAQAETLPPVVHIYARRTPEEFAAIVGAVEQVLEELLTLEGQPILVTTQPFRG